MLQLCIKTPFDFFLEENNVIMDKQNGFRKDRSCADHVFTLNICSVIQNRTSTFGTFVDIRKAFVFVDYILLQCKLYLQRNSRSKYGQKIMCFYQ